MNFDLSQFDNLELDNIGQWPPAAKALAAAFVAVAVFIFGYMVFVSDKITQLERIQAEEQTLKESYRTKYNVAANLELFRQQMKEAEELFAEQLKILPESHETPGLLDDITFVGTTSGLDFTTLSWKPEITQEIYVELPIEIEVIGSYHEFGKFVSKIADLPRIVTVHDFDIKTLKDKGEHLTLKLQAKTYRYSEEGAK